MAQVRPSPLRLRTAGGSSNGGPCCLTYTRVKGGKGGNAYTILYNTSPLLPRPVFGLHSFRLPSIETAATVSFDLRNVRCKALAFVQFGSPVGGMANFTAEVK